MAPVDNNPVFLTTEEVLELNKQCINFKKKYPKNFSIQNNAEYRNAIAKIVAKIAPDIRLKTNESIFLHDPKNNPIILNENSCLGHIAACLDWPALLDYFIFLDGNINEQNIHKETPLHVAIAFEKFAFVDHVLKNSDFENTEAHSLTTPNMKMLDVNKNSYMHLLAGKWTPNNNVALRNYKSVVRKILNLSVKQGIDINLPNVYGNTPAHVAINNDNLWFFGELLKYGRIDFRKTNQDGRNIIQELFESVSDINNLNGFIEQIIIGLKDHAQDILEIEVNDNNFLAYCVSHNLIKAIRLAESVWNNDSNSNVFKRLVEDVEKKSEKKNRLNPLIWAAVEFKPGILSILMKAKPKKDIVTLALQGFLSILHKKPQSANIRKKEVNRILDILLQNSTLLDPNSGVNVLRSVARRKDIPEFVIDLILQYKNNNKEIRQDPQFLTCNIDTPLHLALKYENTKFFLKLFAEYGEFISTEDNENLFNIKAKDRNRMDIFHLAIQKKNKEAFICIIKKIGARKILDGFLDEEFEGIHQNIMHILLDEDVGFAEVLFDFMLEELGESSEELRQVLLSTNEKRETFLHVLARKGNNNSSFFMKILKLCPEAMELKNKYDLSPMDIIIKEDSDVLIGDIVKNNDYYLRDWFQKNKELAIKYVGNGNIEMIKHLTDNPDEMLQIAFGVFLKISNLDPNAEEEDKNKMSDLKREELLKKILNQHSKILFVEYLDPKLTLSEQQKQTLLHLAVLNGKPKILGILLKCANNKNLNLKDTKHNTALHLALKEYQFFSTQKNEFLSKKKQCEEIVSLLINKKGFNAFAVNESNETPIRILLQIGNPDWISKALQNWSFPKKVVEPFLAKKELTMALGLNLNKRDLYALIFLSLPKNTSFKDFITDSMISGVKNLDIGAFLCLLRTKNKGRNFFQGMCDAIRIFGFMGIYYYFKNAIQFFLKNYPKFVNKIQIVNIQQEVKKDTMPKEQIIELEEQNDTQMQQDFLETGDQKEEDSKTKETSDWMKEEFVVAPKTIVEDSVVEPLYQKQELLGNDEALHQNNPIAVNI